MLRVPVIAFLTLVWVLLWGSIAPLVIIGGVLVGTLVTQAFPFPPVSENLTLRPWNTVKLIAKFLADLTTASFQVGWLAIRPASPPKSALIEVPLVTDSALLQTLTAELVSLVPGSLLIELDHEGRRMWLHVLVADTHEQVEAARRKAHHQELRVLAAFGRDEELASARQKEAAR